MKAKISLCQVFLLTICVGHQSKPDPMAELIESVDLTNDEKMWDWIKNLNATDEMREAAQQDLEKTYNETKFDFDLKKASEAQSDLDRDARMNADAEASVLNETWLTNLSWFQGWAVVFLGSAEKILMALQFYMEKNAGITVFQDIFSEGWVFGIWFGYCWHFGMPWWTYGENFWNFLWCGIAMVLYKKYSLDYGISFWLKEDSHQRTPEEKAKVQSIVDFKENSMSHEHIVFFLLWFFGVIFDVFPEFVYDITLVYAAGVQSMRLMSTVKKIFLAGHTLDFVMYTYIPRFVYSGIRVFTFAMNIEISKFWILGIIYQNINIGYLVILILIAFYDKSTPLSIQGDEYKDRLKAKDQQNKKLK